MADRREFLKHGSLAAAALWTGACGSGAPATVPAPAPARAPTGTPGPDVEIPARELMMRALDAAGIELREGNSNCMKPLDGLAARGGDRAFPQHQGAGLQLRPHH